MICGTDQEVVRDDRLLDVVGVVTATGLVQQVRRHVVQKHRRGLPWAAPPIAVTGDIHQTGPSSLAPGDHPPDPGQGGPGAGDREAGVAGAARAAPARRSRRRRHYPQPGVAGGERCRCRRASCGWPAACPGSASYAHDRGDGAGDGLLGSRLHLGGGRTASRSPPPGCHSRRSRRAAPRPVMVPDLSGVTMKSRPSRRVL